VKYAGFLRNFKKESNFPHYFISNNYLRSELDIVFFTRRKLLTKMAHIPLAIGVDIGGTSTKIGIVNRAGEILVETHFPTRAQEAFSIFSAIFTEKINTLIAGIDDKYKIWGVGVGAPMAQPFLGVMTQPSNFPGWKTNVPIVKMIEEATNMPTFLTNDANTAALGEWYFGAAKGMKNFIVLTLGTGLGSGIVANGKLLQGEQGMAGEMGHIIASPGGRRCTCGRKGCLETYASVTGIKRTVAKLMADLEIPSRLRDVTYNNLDGLQITQAALDGDILAKKAFAYTGKILGRKVADAVAYFNPEAVILAGGLAKAGDILLKPINYHMNKFLFSAFRNSVKLMISENANANAAVTGSAVLVWENLAKKMPLQ